MTRSLRAAPVGAVLIATVAAAATSAGAATFAESPHDYWKREPADRFARVMRDVGAGKVTLETGAGEKGFVASLLRALEIDDSSQLLVFSATSLQSGIVNPRNPRALYFNEDTYVGFIPGGRIEVASFDADAGMVFYIFDRATIAGAVPDFTRSNRCMNCHADSQSKGRPGIVISSVGVTWDGSTQETYRYDEIGHHVPLAQRFGGWHLTGGHRLPRTHANLVGNITPSGFKGEPNPPGRHSRIDAYLRPTSDILPHLVMEHAAGFTNRVIDAVYACREKPDDAALAARLADELGRYLLFAGEAALPSGGIAGDPDFARDFAARAANRPSAALRTFDLKRRLFRERVSYMLDTAVYRALPAPVRRGIEERLGAVADGRSPWKDLALEPSARRTLRQYLDSTAAVAAPGP